MAFIDELRIHIKSGHGGNGVVRWLHEKGREFMGPAGGNGGRGGSVFMRGVSDLGLLAKYRHQKAFRAEDGGHGESRSMHGRDGKNLIIDVPLGSIVTNEDTGERFDISELGKEVQVLQGGRGGVGNEHFKSSTNVAPQEATDGRQGEEGNFYIEVELVAEAGLIGLPNAGKSSLLNVLTNADAKVGDYQFTTLEPNLGAFYKHIIADIPGLIQGASEGRGLGQKFLRHVRRCKIFFHCISLENDSLFEAYETIRKELEAFDPKLTRKKEIVVFTKSDSLSEDMMKEKIDTFKRELKKISKNVGDFMIVSVYDEASIMSFKKKFREILEK
jgi:GTP-binding protein